VNPEESALRPNKRLGLHAADLSSYQLRTSTQMGMLTFTSKEQEL